MVRGGAGLFFENSIWNNILFDSPARLKAGTFLSTPEVCSGGVAAAFPWPTPLSPSQVGNTIAGAGTIVSTATGVEVQPNFCGGTISAVAPQILALSSAYQAATASVTGPQANPNYIGTSLTALNNSGYDLFYPGYRTPRSWQMNLGVEKEIRPGTVVSLDYIRNAGEHYLIAQRYQPTAAQPAALIQINAENARDAAQTAASCPTGSGSGYLHD